MSDVAARVRELVATHGWNSTAGQLTNPGLETWFPAAGDGVVGLVRTGRWWVVAGAPVAAEGRLAAVATELEAAAEAVGARVAYFAAEARFEQWLATCPGPRGSVLLGAQPLYSPLQWPTALREHASLRAQLTRAKRKGVVVREIDPAAAASDPELARCLATWLDRRGLPPLGFLTTPWVSTAPQGRRLWVAQREGRVVAYLVLTLVPARRFGLVEQIVRGDRAPNGTAELLVDAVMRGVAGSAHDGGLEWLTLGLAPLAERAGDWRDSPLWLRGVVTWARAHGGRFYNFRGLEAFKAKLRPVAWEPVRLWSTTPRVTPGLLWATLAAFSGGSPLKFAVRALGRAAHRELSVRAGRPR